LNDISAGTIPRGGTAITSAIECAMRSYGGGLKKNKILIMITDGEDHEGDPAKAAQRAARDGITIFTIGIGTTEGELIPFTDDKGVKGFLKDKSGNVVKSRLDELMLQKIALATGGSYVRSSAVEFGLDLIYKEKLVQFEKREQESRMKKLYVDRFQIPLTIALIFLLLDTILSDRRKAI
ncbi:MAG: VWA domain-containing protein, partial [Candidatus Omnitrophica bacterium]|nr:VWA domain-containing protein [Candidatus Omnitrophota bacterium]